jgi:ubiquitin thioesterase protein OTUB1
MAVATSISTLESTLPMLELAGFQKMVFEDFYEVLVSIVQQIVKPDHEGKRMTPEMLLEAFQLPEGKFARHAKFMYTELTYRFFRHTSLVSVSNSVVVYLRLLTSAQIRADPDEFAPFLFHPELGIQMEPREFCENFVESVGKEAGQCYQLWLPDVTKQ